MLAEIRDAMMVWEAVCCRRSALQGLKRHVCGKLNGTTCCQALERGLAQNDQRDGPCKRTVVCLPQNVYLLHNPRYMP